MARPLTREEALRVLGLPSTAGPDAVKHAYRRLARVHHPDTGGDGQAFHRVQRAYERLADAPPEEATPRVARGRPSRHAASWRAEVTVDPSPVDIDRIDWSVPLGDGELPLHRDAVAVHLADGSTPLVRPLTATSRAPGSRLNRVAHRLAGDLTAQLRVHAGTDDRHRAVVVVELRGGVRKARRALDRCALDGGWVRLRGSSHTVLRSTLIPSAGRRATAVRVTRHLETLLERLDWPLSSWVTLRSTVPGASQDTAWAAAAGAFRPDASGRVGDRGHERPEPG